jgi:hypothetical protein
MALTMTRVRASVAWAIVALAGAGSVASCGGGQFVDDDASVSMPTHRFTLPTNRPWVLVVDEDEQSTVAQHADTTTSYQFKLRWIPVDEPERRAMSARDLAADYFRTEEARILEVEDGRYRVQDLVTGTEEIGGKVFHTMEYFALTDGFDGRPIGRACFYLLIPSPTDNGAFLAAVFKESTLTDEPLDPDPRRFRDFLDVLVSLTLDSAD